MNRPLKNMCYDQIESSPSLHRSVLQDVQLCNSATAESSMKKFFIGFSDESLATKQQRPVTGFGSMHPISKRVICKSLDEIGKTILEVWMVVTELYIITVDTSDPNF